MKSLFGLSARQRDTPPPLRRTRRIDVEDIRSRLRVEARAKENGERNLPTPDAAAFDSVEQDIISEFETERKEQIQDFRSDLRIRHNQLESLGWTHTIAKIGTLSDEVVGRFSILARQHLDNHHRLRQDTIESARELHVFREHNRISRPARYPQSGALLFSVLAVLVLVESIFNGNFLARGNPQGLLGGVILALAFAAFNVFLGWLTGRVFLVQVLHRNLFRRSLGVLLTIGGLAATGAFNILVAQYREAVAKDPYNAGVLALTGIRTHPFQFSDFESVMLLLAGTVFGLVAAGDGFLWDDPYPGYGRRDRDLREKESDYKAEAAASREEIETLGRSALAEFDAIASQLEQCRGRRADVLQLLASEAKSFEGYLRYLNDICNQILRQYRDTNVAARTKPVPRHFGEAYSFVPDHAVALDEIIRRGELAEREILEGFRLIGVNRERVMEAQHRALDALTQVEDLETADADQPTPRSYATT